MRFANSLFLLFAIAAFFYLVVSPDIGEVVWPRTPLLILLFFILILYAFRKIVDALSKAISSRYASSDATASRRTKKEEGSTCDGISGATHD